MTLDEIKTQLPDEWVLIDYTSLDDELRLIDGSVLAHSPSLYEIDRRLAGLSNSRIAVEFTGEPDFGGECVHW